MDKETNLLKAKIKELEKENLLLQTRQNYETFFNTINDFLFVLDEHANIIHTNSTVIERLGYTREELAGNSVLMVHPANRREEAGRIVDEMLMGTTEFCPVPLVTKSGKQIQVETRVRHGIWNGKPAIFGVTIDISKIALSEEKFSKVFYLNPLACGFSDIETGEYVEVNEAFYTLFGFDKNEVIGKTASELGILTQEARTSILSKISNSEVLTNVEADLKAKNGDIKHVLLSAENIIIQDKKLRYTVVHDITERIKKEENLHFTKFSINNIGESIFWIDKSAKIDFVNNPACNNLGYSREELVKMTVFDVYPQITEEKWEKHWQKIFKHETLNFETFHKRKGGGEFSVEVTYNSINFGELQYCCVVDRDITERKKVELKLKESEQMLQIANATKDKFFSIIAHDLRSPFSGIIGLSELLIENVKEFDIAKSEKHLGFINSSAKNTLILLDNLLNWAKSQTGNIIVKPENIILSKVIQEIIEASNFTAKSKNISLNYSSLDEIEVYADENMLLVILRNLISNAIKFTKPGGEVNVSAISKQNQVKISISDNGVGMNEEKLKDLLNISSNATSPGTANEKGSGLGLVLCKEFVEKLGGNIWVESEEGKGSIFYFTLPYTSEMITENTVKDEVLPPVKVTPIKKLKIVIAEDDETSAMFISITVKKFSSEIISVRTGTEAVDACRNNPDIDLVLMDIQMPEINGYEAIRQIRKFNKGVIIIAQTAFALEGDREKAMTAGCDDYITKPIKKDELLKKIEKLFS